MKDYIMKRQAELERKLWQAERDRDWPRKRKIEQRIEELRQSVINNNN